jgi:hypothetical protein
VKPAVAAHPALAYRLDLPASAAVRRTATDTLTGAGPPVTYHWPAILSSERSKIYIAIIGVISWTPPALAHPFASTRNGNP